MEIVFLIILAGVLMFGFSVFFGAPFVPTRRKWAESAIKLADVKSKDVVVDLGSGTGIVLKLAAERGATAQGYEINPILALVSKTRLTKFGDRATIKIANFWKVDLPHQTTVVYVFAVERDEQKLISYLKKQAKKVDTKQLRVISFGLPLSDEKSVAKADGANLYIF
jgi:16S rRNA A1518/A1519 N6-dimethyltransferase RsmA/KsgA/DIM1 with predicted DNA glycosylase/AP lyase activity